MSCITLARSDSTADTRPAPKCRCADAAINGLTIFLMLTLALGPARPAAADQVRLGFATATAPVPEVRTPRVDSPTPLTTAALGMARTAGTNAAGVGRRMPPRWVRATQSGAATSATSTGAQASYVFSLGMFAGALGFTLYGASDQCLQNKGAATCEGYKKDGTTMGLLGALAFGVGLFLDSQSKKASRSGSQGSAAAPGTSASPATPPVILKLRDPEAEQRARDAIAEIRGGDHSTLPPAVVTGFNGSGQTTSTFTNRTSYTLTVHVSGPVALSLTIPPGGSQQAPLAPGRYEVGASVSASSVLPYYGVRDYQAGGLYTDDFYIRPQR